LNLAVCQARKNPHNRKCTMQAGRPVLFWFCSGLVWSLVWFGFRFESGFGSVLGPGAVCGSWGRGTRVVGAVMCLYISWNDRNWIKFMRFARRRWNRIGSPHGPESETRKKMETLRLYWRSEIHFPPYQPCCRNFGFWNMCKGRLMLACCEMFFF